MTYVLLNNLFGLFRQTVGQWWFDTQAPIDWGPALDTVSNYHGDDDGEGPMPPSDSDKRPKCKTCKGPNYSLEKDTCIACRLGIG